MIQFYISRFRLTPEEITMPTPFEVAMTVLAVGELTVFAMVLTLAFPNSWLYHYLYDGDELFDVKS